MKELLIMSDVTKSFFGTPALKSGRIEILPGEIHALIGANGAGKSTLMKILYGILKADGGTIRFDGKDVCFRSVAEAQAAGIYMVHQELSVAKDLTVAQNIFLGRERMKGLSIDDNSMIAECERLFEAMGLDINPAEKMGALPPAKQQLTQIAALLTYKPKLIILDEPTTALGEEDVRMLFDHMRQLKSQGISMIFISHRLDELFEISDRITVMRGGDFIICEKTSDITKEQLVYYMAGKAVGIEAKTESLVPPDAPVVLEVSDLSTPSYLHDISFSLKKGEILGFTGLMGSGRTEVARAICGLDPISGGKITVNGKAVRIHSPVDAAKCGMGYLSEDRNEEGLIYGKNVIFNTAVSSLDRYQKGISLNDKAITEDALEFNQRVGTVTSNFSTPVENLSGGNRQKVIIARALMKDLQILILDEPTRGIDVSAKDEIYEITKQLARDGHSVILMSSETEEIRALCDRVLVMYEGTVEGELKAGEVTPENIMYYAAGMREDKVNG